jgi:hypothetical protein
MAGEKISEAGKGAGSGVFACRSVLPIVNSLRHSRSHSSMLRWCSSILSMCLPRNSITKLAISQIESKVLNRISMLQYDACHLGTPDAPGTNAKAR